MLTSLYSLFYITGECYMFLHRGWTKMLSVPLTWRLYTVPGDTWIRVNLLSTPLEMTWWKLVFEHHQKTFLQGSCKPAKTAVLLRPWPEWHFVWRMSAIYHRKFLTDDVRVNFVILHKLSLAVIVNRNQTFFDPSLHAKWHTGRAGLFSQATWKWFNGLKALHGV